MSKTKLIYGHPFTVSEPYTEGHVITAAEAKALNQVRAENIGNNLREKLKELLDAGNTTEAEALVAARDAEYVFTMSSGAGTVKRDPVEAEARKLARELIKAKLAESGRKVGTAPEGYTDESWKEYIESKIDEVAAIEDVLKQAKKNVDEKTKKSKQLLESTGSVSL